MNPLLAIALAAAILGAVIELQKKFSEKQDTDAEVKPADEPAPTKVAGNNEVKPDADKSSDSSSGGSDNGADRGASDPPVDSDSAGKPSINLDNQ